MTSVGPLSRPDESKRYGQEVRAIEGDKLSIIHDTGVVTVSRADEFEEVTTLTTHYSPSAWGTVMSALKFMCCIKIENRRRYAKSAASCDNHGS